jgi:hypothetical protein
LGAVDVRRLIIRAGLLSLAVPQAAIGAWAYFAPRTFHDDFPLPGRHWVAAFGSFDGHLTPDFGASALALALILAAAAVLLDRALVLVALGGWLVWAIAHLVRHALERGSLRGAGEAANFTVLVYSVVVPVALLGLTCQLGAAHRGIRAREIP